VFTFETDLRWDGVRMCLGAMRTHAGAARLPGIMIRSKTMMVADICEYCKVAKADSIAKW
jgi:hypothetical protein